MHLVGAMQCATDAIIFWYHGYFMVSIYHSMDKANRRWCPAQAINSSWTLPEFAIMQL